MSDPPRKRGNPNWQPGGSDYRPASGIPASGEAAFGISAGPAANPPREFSTDYQPTGALKAAGADAKKIMTAYLVSKRMAAAERIVALIEGDDVPPQVQLNASAMLLNRLDGTPAASVHLTGGDDKPSATAYRWATEEELKQDD